MDIVYYRREDANVPANESADPFVIGPNYIKTHPNIAVPYLIVIILATISGTVGNILVIGAVVINKHLRTVGNMFLVNLAVADLCVAGFVDPFSIIGIVRGEVYFSERPVLCEFVASLCLTSCFCSLLSIGMISLNRLVHICYNHLYERIYTKLNTVLMCIALWIVSFLAEMPNFFGWGDHVYDRKTLSCVWDRTADFSYSFFFSAVGVAFPVILISICYIKIFLHVRASKTKVRQMSNTVSLSEKSALKEKNESVKLARTLCLIFVVFAVCWSPYAVIVVADRYDTFPLELHIFSVLIAHTNSSLNSVLYGLTNKHFRRGYMKLLGIRWCLAKIKRKKSNQMTLTDADGTSDNTYIGLSVPDPTRLSVITSSSTGGVGSKKGSRHPRFLK